MAPSLFETGGFWHADKSARSPDIQFHLGLRVAEASIMATAVSSNTNASTIMIGEKAADMIRADHGT